MYLISVRDVFSTHQRLCELYYHYDTGVMTSPLHHPPFSSYIIFLLKLKARFDVNFTVNLFCPSVPEIFIHVERKVASA